MENINIPLEVRGHNNKTRRASGNSVEKSFLNNKSMMVERAFMVAFSPMSKAWGFVLFSLSFTGVLLLCLVLFSYHHEDPGFSHISSGDEIRNLLGFEGAWVADFIYLLFGFGAWVIVFGGLFFLVRGWKRLNGHALRASSKPMGLRILALVLFVLAGCTFFFLRFHSYDNQLPGTAGGAIGSTIGTELLYWLDFDWATSLLLLVLALSLSTFLDFSWISFCESIGRAIEEVVGGVIAKRSSKTDATIGLENASKWKVAIAKNATKQKEAAGASHRIVSMEQIRVSGENKDITGFAPMRSAETKTRASTKAEQPALELDEPDEATQPVTADTTQNDASLEQTFVLPDESLLSLPTRTENILNDNYFSVLSQRIELILADFHIEAKVKGILKGPVITRFRLLPKPGEKSKRFVNVAQDLARRLGISSVRVVENMREADFIGLEIPNPKEAIRTINFRGVIESRVFKESTAPLTLGLGVDVSGQAVVTNLAKAPHLLVAGTTGSGKSVGINSMILSMLYKNTPEKLRLILIDPKQVEFTPYIDIPHLMAPVISDMSEASRALGWACKEMERRYSLFSKAKVRNIESYNEKVVNGDLEQPMTVNPDTGEDVPWKDLPYIVVIIDELADLLQTHKKEVEPAIIQLAQKARAAGIHLILATQRPSADIITPVIKSNCPTRISFKVGSRYDSATILDQQGAEDLLGRGDMLLRDPTGALIRIHGAFVTDEEIERVTQFLKSQAEPEYVEGVTEEPEEKTEGLESLEMGEKDQLYDQAVRIVIEENRASVCHLQRRFHIGYNRAANLVERMEREGIVSKPNNVGKRQILVSKPPEV